jgi:hypothetical protein
VGLHKKCTAEKAGFEPVVNADRALAVRLRIAKAFARDAKDQQVLSATPEPKAAVM